MKNKKAPGESKLLGYFVPSSPVDEGMGQSVFENDGTDAAIHNGDAVNDSAEKCFQDIRNMFMCSVASCIVMPAKSP